MNKYLKEPWTINRGFRTAINSGNYHIAMVNYYNHPDSPMSIEEHEELAELIRSAPELKNRVNELEEKLKEYEKTNLQYWNKIQELKHNQEYKNEHNLLDALGIYANANLENSNVKAEIWEQTDYGIKKQGIVRIDGSYAKKALDRHEANKQ